MYEVIVSQMLKKNSISSPFSYVISGDAERDF